MISEDSLSIEEIEADYELGLLKKFVIQASNYKGIFEAPLWTPDYGERSFDVLPHGSLALDLKISQQLDLNGARATACDSYIPVDWILRGSALAPPWGLNVLKPLPPPTEPTWSEHTLKTENVRRSLIEDARTRIKEKVREDRPNIARAAEIAAACKQGNPAAMRILLLITFRRHPLPGLLARGEPEFALDVGSRVALCTIEVPELTKLPFAKKRAKWVPASEADRKQAAERILHALCIRAAYLVAMGDPGDFFDTVAVNAHQKWVDPAIGRAKEGIVASLEAPKDLLCQLEPEHLDAKACFRHLRGISTPDLLNAAPIRPIFVMDTHDSRIVANKDVASQLDETTNLAAMPWEDFEHLVSQVFEWLFAKDGIEVKVTRASRDRGVDAIMFDSDPIRGGKYVLQAKRYTRTVDVAAVRDLYGTVVNEGANRGILVTTASYGADAYEFAKDKPISLIDGPNLIALLKQHGRSYRIDLEEARRLELAGVPRMRPHPGA